MRKANFEGWIGRVHDHRIAEKQSEAKEFDFGYDEYETGLVITMRIIEAMEKSGTATDEEFARAIKYLGVAVDMKKHLLDLKKAYTDLGIASLREKYTDRS